jgi:hypothetical protein
VFVLPKDSFQRRGVSSWAFDAELVLTLSYMGEVIPVGNAVELASYCLILGWNSTLLTAVGDASADVQNRSGFWSLNKDLTTTVQVQTSEGKRFFTSPLMR